MSWFLFFALFFWLFTWFVNVRISRTKLTKLTKVIPPIFFGASLILIWEASISAFNVSAVILPAPSAVFTKLLNSTTILWIDFVQTFIKGALSGFIIGCSAALFVTLIVDRYKFYLILSLLFCKNNYSKLRTIYEI